MDLAKRWSAEAESLSRWGDDRGAAILRRCAAELTTNVQAHDNEEMTITEAAAASGYSADHLRSLVASGEIPNAGRRGSPRIYRKDLPRKPSANGGAS